jgi:protein involved in polysaccharide export with SLBB domain
MSRTATPQLARGRRPVTRFLLVVALLPVAAWSGGCASFTNPVADGIPVRRLPEEVLGRPREELRPLPLNLLRQREPDQYRVDKGDLLGVYVEDVLGIRGQPIPIQIINNPLSAKAAAQGYPVPVQDDGTIIIPELPPLKVKGLTIPEVRALVFGAVTGDPKVPGSRQLLRPDAAKVLVDLVQPRTYSVLVVREDTQPVPLTGGAGVFGGNKKGAGFTVRMEAYKNDLLHALNATGGPPGLDAKNEVVIRRGQYDPSDPTKGFVRIPLRARPEDPITFTEQDIILDDGDTVYIEARDTEVYYTAGIVGGNQIPLPRDYDLRVIEALAQVRAPLINGSFQNNAFVANAVNVGLGNPNPSLVSVVRRIPGTQKQIVIRVDVNLAFQDPRENILIQPGDIIVLQERPGEALVRYITQTIRFNTTWRVIRGMNFNVLMTGNNP